MENEAVKIEFIPIVEVAEMFGTTAPKIKAGILNGTLPIGTVMREGDGKDVTRIPKKRLMKWVNGEL